MLYAVSNLATDVGIRDAIMASSIPTLLPTYLTRSTPATTLLPAAWCVINLSWPDESQQEAAAGAAGNRVRALVDLGLPGVLRALLEHVACQDVRERVRTALDHFKP